jgi:hypothetical protein
MMMLLFANPDRLLMFPQVSTAPVLYTTEAMVAHSLSLGQAPPGSTALLLEGPPPDALVDEQRSAPSACGEALQLGADMGTAPCSCQAELLGAPLASVPPKPLPRWVWG